MTEEDSLIALAIGVAAEDLSPRPGEAGEKALRDGLMRVLDQQYAGVVEAERAVLIPEFQGVGPVDLVLSAGVDQPAWGLIECKWSFDIGRNTIFECAWDAIKLALAAKAGGELGWLVAGAPTGSWSASETADLFEAGTVSTRELWDRPLMPRGPNQGATVGADCELGGRGNMFTHAPATLIITPVASVPVTGGWEIRASRVTGEGDPVRFADPPEFPQSINQAWLDTNVPGMDEKTYQRLLARLKLKRWTSSDLATRVAPLRATAQQ